MRAEHLYVQSGKKNAGNCFSCIGLIEKKAPAELDAFETAKLLDYKLYQLNLDEFARKVNQNYKKNGGQDEILYSMNRDVERMLKVTTEIHNPAQNLTRRWQRWEKACAVFTCCRCLKHIRERKVGSRAFL